MFSLDVEPGVSGYMNLTAEQRNTIQVAERVGASLSLAGVVFVIVTYALFKKVRNVSNTFIFYASVANVGASIACLIGYDGIEKNNDDDPLCQAQAFLLEMFMQSDPWWSLSMAINVFMVFFLHCNADASMKNMWIYSVISFGMPAVPAFICLFVRPNGTPIYGNATLWCWIGDVYNPLRIYSYYVPIWACIFITTIIYLAIGYHVFHGRNQLRDLTMSTQVHEFTTTSEVRDSAEKSLAGGQTGATITTTTATYGTVTTEVQVTTSAECSESTTGGNTRPTTPLPPSMAPQIMPANQNHQHHNSTGSGIAVVAGNSTGSASAASQMIHPWTSISSSSCSNDDAISALTITSATPASPTSTTGISNTTTLAPTNTNSISAVPLTGPFTTTISSIARPLRTNKNHNSPTLSPSRPNERRSQSRRTGPARYLDFVLRPARKLRRMLNGLDPIKLAYLRTSFIFAVSVLVTWTPSSINRVYTLMNPKSANFGLNLASAIVLPLQGVWNVVIYVLTTWEGLNEEVYKSIGWAPGGRWRERRRRRRDDHHPPTGTGTFGPGGNGGGFGYPAAAGGAGRSEFGQSSTYRQGHHHDISSSTAGDLESGSNNENGNGPIGMSVGGISRRDHSDFDFEDDELPINRAQHMQPPPSPRYMGPVMLDGSSSLGSSVGGIAGSSSKDRDRDRDRDRPSWKKKGTVRILRNGSL
ncbi:hypothetical protein V8F33_002646 [Rhypophila sp. PSN 637]